MAAKLATVLAFLGTADGREYQGQLDKVMDETIVCNPECFDEDFTCESCCSTGLSRSGNECFREHLEIWKKMGNGPSEVFEACCTYSDTLVNPNLRGQNSDSQEELIETERRLSEGSSYTNAPSSSPTPSSSYSESSSSYTPTPQPTPEPTPAPTTAPTLSPTLYVFGELTYMLTLAKETPGSFSDAKTTAYAKAVGDSVDIPVQYIKVAVKNHGSDGLNVDVKISAPSQDTYLNAAAALADVVGYGTSLKTSLATEAITFAETTDIEINIGEINFGASPVMRRKAPAVAHYRFEDTMPSAYYRMESAYTDHSGNSHHLAFFETVGTSGTPDMKYDNSLDGVPQNTNCMSNVGLSCTSLRWWDPDYIHADNSNHYFVDKRHRDDWVAYSGSFTSSDDVPPIAMFNVPAAPQPFQTTFRKDLYTVTTHAMPGGAGLRSLDAEAMTTNSSGWILAYNASVAAISGDKYTTETTSALSFTDDFTVEGFFKASTKTEKMTILMQEKGMYTPDAAETFAYTVDLNAGGDEGALRFAIAGEISGTKTIREVKLSNRNYADGNWHYFVARHNKLAYENENSMGKLELKTYSDNGDLKLMEVSRPQLNFGLTSVESNFQIYSGKGNMHLGGTGMYQSSLRQKFKGKLDEVRFNYGLVNDEDLLGLVGADYVQMPTPPTCTGQKVIKDRIGSFNDGTNATTEYPNNLACSWLIDHSELNKNYQHDMFIAITFTRFSTEPNMDTVTVYDGDSMSAPVLGVFSGYDLPTAAANQTPLVSSSTKVLVVFSSDGQQRGPQLGWALKFASISMAQRECNAVAEGHTLSLACPAGHVISKVNFASYGAGMTGYCSNAAGPVMATAQSDVDGYVLPGNDNSNQKSSIMNYAEADDVMVDTYSRAGGAGNQLAGPVLFRTGFCHAEKSREVVENACRGQSSCSINATNAVFSSGTDPCHEFSDSRLGSEGDGNDASVKGTDSFPRHDIPYSSPISKKLFVQVTCEATMAFASNCFEECEGQGTCLYGLKTPHCSWCGKYGLVRNQAGAYEGDGCGKAYCTKSATCGTKITMT